MALLQMGGPSPRKIGRQSARLQPESTINPLFVYGRPLRTPTKLPWELDPAGIGL